MNWERKYTIARLRLREALRNQIPVRCKGCKFCNVVPGEKPRLVCYFMYTEEGDYYDVEPDDFCAWGEKE